jgi:hypothetical protein
MALVVLPSDHLEADLSLATEIALHLELEELHVFTYVDQAPESEAPESEVAPAPARAAEPAPEGGLARLAAALDELFERVADLIAPWSVPESRQPKMGKLRRRASRSTPACSTDTTSRSLRST